VPCAVRIPQAAFTAVACGARYTSAVVRDEHLGCSILYSWGARAKSSALPGKVDKEDMLGASLSGLPHDIEGLPGIVYEPVACVALWPGSQFEVGRPLKYWPAGMDAFVAGVEVNWRARGADTLLEGGQDADDSLQVSALLRELDSALQREEALRASLGRDLDRLVGHMDKDPDNELALFELERALRSITSEHAAMSGGESEDDSGAAARKLALRQSMEVLRATKDLFQSSPSPPHGAAGTKGEHDQTVLLALYEDVRRASVDMLERVPNDDLLWMVDRSTALLDQVLLGLACCTDCGLKNRIAQLAAEQRARNEQLVGSLEALRQTRARRAEAGGILFL
jgi:hypothetical protein